MIEQAPRGGQSPVMTPALIGHRTLIGDLAEVALEPGASAAFFDEIARRVSRGLSADLVVVLTGRTTVAAPCTILAVSAGDPAMSVPGDLEELAARVSEELHPRCLSSPMDDEEPLHRAMAQHGMRSALIAPVSSERQARLCVALFSRRPQAFGSDDLECASLVAQLATLRRRLARSEERLESQAALQASVRELEARDERHELVQQLAHLGYWDRDYETGELTWSDETYRIFGVEPSVVEEPAAIFYDAVHPDDRECVLDALNAALVDGSEYRVRHRLLRPDGSTPIVDEVARLYHDARGEPLRLVGTVHDVTERVRAEEELDALARERQQLVQQLLVAQEEERRTVAYDIHDGPVQEMTAALMFLDSHLAEARTNANPRLTDLERAIGQLELGLRETRRIMAGLRPALLDDHGLVEAVRAPLEEQTEGSLLKIEVDSSGFAGDVCPALEVSMFRIVQEAVANALKHSGTGRIAVRMYRDCSQACLEVRDWGAGFDPGAVAGPKRGARFGLAGMRERAELLGGRLEVRSQPGAGTTISATIPLTN